MYMDAYEALDMAASALKTLSDEGAAIDVQSRLAIVHEWVVIADAYNTLNQYGVTRVE